MLPPLEVGLATCRAAGLAKAEASTLHNQNAGEVGRTRTKRLTKGDRAGLHWSVKYPSFRIAAALRAFRGTIII